MPCSQSFTVIHGKTERLALEHLGYDSSVAQGDGSRHIKRTSYTLASAVDDVRVDHGGAHVGVSEQFLNSANVIPRLQQVGREGAG
jgi:hypothetical protein